MNFESATDDQLMLIINDDKHCPNDLLHGVAIEMVRRDLWENIIFYTARMVYKNADAMIANKLRMSKEEFKHISHIHIYSRISKFKQGMRTFKTYIIMSLRDFFIQQLRNTQALMRSAMKEAVSVDELDVKLQDRILRMENNTERIAVNKLFIEEMLKSLNPNEQKAIRLEMAGYSQYEISRILGYRDTYAYLILKRAYAKLNKLYGAEAV